uniref:Uncharacterized protein n=1 Tax=Molossus molossus TaxID=27622 RepID=A0A7J8GQY6_MOLMO|nr:hypothetical protein HJG59_011349 [Molossus molossus]
MPSGNNQNVSRHCQMSPGLGKVGTNSLPVQNACTVPLRCSRSPQFIGCHPWLHPAQPRPVQIQPGIQESWARGRLYTDACEEVGGEEAQVLTSGKVHICFIFCRIQLITIIVSTITMITRDFFLFT